MNWESGPYQIIFFVVGIYQFGFIYGILAIIAFYYALDIALKFVSGKITGKPISFVNGVDIEFTFDDMNCNNYNVCSVLETERIDPELFKQLIKEKLTSRIARLRSSVFTAYGFWFWKDHGTEGALDVIEEIKEKIQTKEEMLAFVSKIRRQRFKIGDILWKVYYQKDFINGQSLMIFNVHHIISDAMGMAS